MEGVKSAGEEIGVVIKRGLCEYFWSLGRRGADGGDAMEGSGLPPPVIPIL